MTFVLFYHQSCSECSESRHEYPESLLDALPIGIQPCSLLKQQKGQEASLERHMFFFFFFNIYIYRKELLDVANGPVSDSSVCTQIKCSKESARYCHLWMVSHPQVSPQILKLVSYDFIWYPHSKSSENNSISLTFLSFCLLE